MAFIVEQHFKFACDIQQLREAQAQTDQIVAHTAEVVGQTGEVVARLANGTLEGFKDVNSKINALVDSQIRLNDAQSRTDESLKNLIAVVGSYFSEARKIK
jgi:hypothetical protein